MFRIATVAVPLAVMSALLATVTGRMQHRFLTLNERMMTAESPTPQTPIDTGGQTRPGGAPGPGSGKTESDGDGKFAAYGRKSGRASAPTEETLGGAALNGRGDSLHKAGDQPADKGMKISGNLMKRRGDDVRHLWSRDNAKVTWQDGHTKYTLATPHDHSLRIIRNADVTLKVKNFQAQWDTVGQIARSVGGFIAESNVSKDEDSLSGAPAMQGTITVRVPEKFFESALERISKLGTLEGKQVSSQDVSQEYTDTTSRMRNLKSREARLLVLMDHAKKLQDILRIETELNRVRDEIEKATGRLKFLGNQTTYSTINVSMHEKAKKKPVPAGGWTFKKEAKNAYAALKDALKVAATVAIWTVIYVPFYLVLVAIGLAAYRQGAKTWKPAAQ